jgi:membrane associated rhomboid family serine protease
MDSDERHGEDSTPEEAMSPPDEHAVDRRVDLVAGGAVLFESTGFRIVDSRGGLSSSPLHPYESLSHVYVADRILLIGTRSGLLTIRNRHFDDPESGPEVVKRLLLERLASQRDGAALLARMADVDRLGARSSWSVVTWTTIALCLFGTAFQLRDPLFEQVGAFVPDLFARGEYWRGVTIHFLHGLSGVPLVLGFFLGNLPGLPVHLALNVGGLLVLGHLVERPLGSWRTAIILALSGVGTVVGILIANHLEVIGASGLVSGLAGAILAIELRYPSSLPSFWRLPRRLFIGAVIVQFGVIDQILWRHVAGGAHLGGFVGGFVAAWMLGRPSMASLAPSAGLRLATYGALSVLILGLLGGVPLTRHDMAALERHAIRLLNSPPAPNLYRHDNAAAWFIATEGDASPFGLGLAVALADRAVEGTGRAHAGILDTLAEALFQSGNRLGALLTIDEAIRLAPQDSYYVEQRRRFVGERAAEDRPPPPESNGWGDLPFDTDERGPIDPFAPHLTI